jgi:hypothetical protein
MQSAEWGNGAMRAETGLSPHRENFNRFVIEKTNGFRGSMHVYRGSDDFRVKCVAELSASGDRCPLFAVSPRSSPPIWRAIRA